MSQVSIIVPIYNAQEYLPRCIQSLRAQTLEDIEIILINDGSTDASGHICDEYKAQDSRMKVIHQHNTGQGIARNAGIKIANSPYIGFVDADDHVEPQMFEILYQTAIKGNADIVMCNCYEIIDGISHPTHLKIDTNELDHEQVLEQILLPMIGGETVESHYQYNIPGYLWRCLYKASLIKPIEMQSERDILFEDLWFNIQAIYQSKQLMIVPDHLYHYIHYDDSFVRTYKQDIWERKQRLNHLIEKFFSQNEKLHDIRKRMDVRQIVDLLESINNEVYDKNKKSAKEQKDFIAHISQDKRTQQALESVTIGNISKYQKLRLKLIEKQCFNLVYNLSKIAYRYKRRTRSR